MARTNMNYSTLGFIRSLKLKRRNMWHREFVDPISGATYGYIFELWPVAILKITGWDGERITVFKFFKRELVW
jgi:hypothetical protein